MQILNVVAAIDVGDRGERRVSQQHGDSTAEKVGIILYPITQITSIM